MDERPIPPGGQANTASLTTASAGLFLWILDRYLFHGTVPAEVATFVWLAFPALCGRLGAQIHYRRAKARLDYPKAP